MIDRALSSKISNMGVVCAILVVLLHICPRAEVGSLTWCCDRFFNDGIGRAAVPFFFSISGFFLARHIDEDGWWGRAICGRLGTLLVPYLIWNCLWLIMPLVLDGPTNLLKGQSVFSNIDVSEFMRVGQPFVLPPLGPTWYIRTLLLFVVLSPLFVAMLRYNAKMTLAVSFLLYVMLYRSESVPFGTWRAMGNTPFALEGLVYFLIGIKLAMENKPRDISRIHALVIFSVALIFTVVRIYCKARGHVVVYNHTRFLVVPGFLLMLWKIAPSCVWPKWMTSSAFAIYLIHPFAIFLFRKCVDERIEGPIHYFLCASLAVFVPIAFKLILSKTSGRLSSFVFGGR